MSGILRLESLTKGDTLKQGDKTPLKYRLFDVGGEKLSVAGKPAKVRLAHRDFLTIGYEKDGLTVAQDDTVTFTIDSIIPPRIYYVEIIVDDKFIFPSRPDESKFTVNKSSLGVEADIIQIIGKEEIARDVKARVEDELVPFLEEIEQAETQRQANEQIVKSKAEEAITKANQADTLSESVQSQFNQVVIDGDSSVEAAQARVDASGHTNATLKERLDKEHNEVAAQLAQKVYYFNTVNEMKNKNQLKVGSFVTTSGYHVGGDGGGANYLIIDTINEDVDHYEALNNGLYASLTSIKEHGYVDVRWLGAKSDLDKSVTPHQGTDVAPYFEKALAITNKNLGMRIKVIGNYYWGSEIDILTDLNLFGEHNSNRLLVGSTNNPSLRVKSPSEIYVEPTLTQAITLEGMGRTESTSARATHFTMEKIYLHSIGAKANFIRIISYGAPSRPSWVQDLHAHGLKYVLFFDYDEPTGSSGTHTYNFSVRGGCDVYSVETFIKSNARSANNPGLGGLSVYDNSLEWTSGGSIQAQWLFGYNRIQNNLLEGSTNGFNISIGSGVVDIKGNYFEANSGDVIVKGSSPAISFLDMGKNYYLKDVSNFYIEYVHLLGYDERLPKSNLSLALAEVDDPKWLNGLVTSKQKRDDDTSYNYLTVPDLPLVDGTTIKDNQFILDMGNDFISPNIKGKLLTGSKYVSLPSEVPIKSGDITVVCYYATSGTFFRGYYDSEYVNNGHGRDFYSDKNTFIIEIYHHIKDMDQLRILFREVDENVKISDPLVTVLKGSQKETDLSDWLGVPHSNAIN